MRALIIGASGFLGSRLVRALTARGHDVVAASSRSTGSASVRVDVADMESVATALAMLSPGVVINLAGAGLPGSGRANMDPWTVNDWGARVVAQAILESSTRPRLVHAASALEEELEDMQFDYARSKAAGSKGVARLLGDGRCSYSIVRIHNVYGPGQPSGRFVGDVIEALRAGRAFVINHPGRMRDFCFVDDVVAHLADISELDETPSHLEVGTGSPSSLLEAAKTIAEAMRADPSLVKFLDQGGNFEQGGWGREPDSQDLLTCTTSLSAGIQMTVRNQG